jgi:molybdate transport system substrate-binding protein
VVVLAMLAAVAVAAGCGRNATTAGKTETTLLVLVPCGQMGPFSEVEDLFKQAHPEIKLDWAGLNMVTMTEEVLGGKKKPDAFLSMGDLEVDRLAKAGLILPETRAKYADNAIVLTVPADNPAGVQSFMDLAKPEVKAIAIPNPKVNSVGAHAIEALKGAGIWDQVKGKIVTPQFAADSQELGKQGRVEASIGYYPCESEVHVKGGEPATPKGTKMIGFVPAEYYSEFSCEAVVVKGCKDPEGGKLLIAALQTPEAQAVFRKWNFARAKQEAE